MQANNKSEKSTTTNDRSVLVVQLGFLILLGAFYIYQGYFPSIEMLLATSVILLLWRAQSRKLLRDLLPFFILLLTFQSLRSFADNLTVADIHITDLIRYEKTLFHGHIPSSYLQSLLPELSSAPYIILLANIFYMSHFINPLIIAIIIWYKNHSDYWYFVGGLVVLTYAGFITYFIFPAAPPWWATKYGYLTDQTVVLSRFFYPSLVEFAGPNPVAAMPSLHMAYPTFIFLFSLLIWKRKGLFLLPLPILIGLSTLFLGHHYVIDLIAGAIYALIVFIGVLIIRSKKMTQNPKGAND